MGEIEQDLCRFTLPDREPHSSRMFIDLCENIHIHHRDLRIVFSLDEFFEFANILALSAQDARNYLAQNPQYREGTYRDAIMIPGGNVRLRALIRNSPRPNQSHYMANDFAIELQSGRTTDEIHVHWRDYRFSLGRAQFRVIAEGFKQALENLDEYERTHTYVRKPHSDRTMDSFEEERKKYDDVYSGIQGVVRLPLSQVKSRYQNIVEDWDYDREWVQQLAEDLKAGKDCFPLLVSTEKDNTHEVIDGNHRLCAAHIAGIRDIPCVVVPITFEESEPFRKVESLLKKFDRHTQHRFQLTGFNKEWLAYKLNRFYINHYYRKVTLRQIKPFKYWYDLKQQFYKLRRKAKRAVMAPFMRYE